MSALAPPSLSFESTLMYQEACSSATLIAAQLQANAEQVRVIAERLRKNPPTFVVTCARGSSDHAATFAKYLFETQIGCVTASASPSIGSVYGVRPRLHGALFVAISQSGRSPDLLRNAEIAKECGAHVLALVNAENTPLAALADDVIALRAGEERSVAATKSYLCTLSALLQLAAYWSDDQSLLKAMPSLPDALKNALAQDWSPLVEGLQHARNLFVIGRGLGLGAAQEAALKLKETCGLHAEAFSSAEVKHGPMAIVGPELPVLCFAQDDATGEGTQALATSFRQRGAPVWLAASEIDCANLPLAEAAHPAFTPLLTIASFYRAAAALSVARGFNPDVPPFLNKVTETL